MKTTFSRAFFPAAMILLAALLLVGTSFQFFVRSYLQESAIKDLKNNGSTIAQMAAAYHADNSFSHKDFLINLSVASQISQSDAVICDPQGTLLLCSHSPLGCQHQGMRISSQAYLDQILEQGFAQGTGLIHGLYTDARYVVAMPIRSGADGRNIGIVMVSRPIDSTTAILKQLSDIYLFVSLLVVLASFAIMTVYARKQSAPLRDMAQAASAFGHGELNARVRVDSDATREIRELALAFNNMADSLEKAEYQRKEFVANVSHELKTPMTTIGGYVDGMLDGTIPQEKQHHYMQIVSNETKRLSRLVRSMLDISQLQDQNIPDERKNRFDVSECAGQVLLTFEQKINAKDLNVIADMPPHPVFTLANEDSITQVIYNLLDNAVKFCTPGGDLTLTVQEDAAKVYVTVSNQGETIPPQELPLVFDRFHKLDKSRSQNRDGWGLGLYIVKTIVCSHGEDISVTSTQGKTAFTFTLPLVN